MGDNNEKYFLSYGVKVTNLFFMPFTINHDVFCKTLSNRDLIREEFRHKYNIESQHCLFIFVGKFIKRKRPIDMGAAATT